MGMELKKMPKRPSKPPPLPPGRTPQQPPAMSGTDLIKMLTGRGAGPLSLLAPTPMVVPKRGNKRGADERTDKTDL